MIYDQRFDFIDNYQKKYFVKRKKIKQSWTRPKYFEICFYISFDCYCQKLIFGREIGHYPVSPAKLKIFFHFLISKDIQC